MVKRLIAELIIKGALREIPEEDVSIYKLLTTWAKAMGTSNSDEAFDVKVDQDKNIIIAGWSSEDWWILKLGISGNIIWQKRLFAEGSNNARSIAIDDNNNLIIAGYGSGYGAGGADVWILKVDKNANVKWFTTVGGGEGTYLDDGCHRIIVTPTNDIIVAGWSYVFGAGLVSGFVIKLDSGGNVQWAKTYGGEESERLYSGVRDPNTGDIIAVGYTTSFGAGDKDIFVIRLDANGNVKWAKAYGSSEINYAYDIALASNGDIIVTGTWTLRLDADGNVKWAKNLGGTGYAIKVLDTGDILIAGKTSSGTGGSDAWVCKLDEGGNIKWAKAYGGSGDDYLYGLDLWNNSIIVGGYTSSFGAGGSDYLCMLLDENGNVEASQLVVTELNPPVNDVSLTITDITSSLTVTDVTNDVTITHPSVDLTDTTCTETIL